jgi:hypothetical protein
MPAKTVKTAKEAAIETAKLNKSEGWRVKEQKQEFRWSLDR